MPTCHLNWCTAPQGKRPRWLSAISDPSIRRQLPGPSTLSQLVAPLPYVFSFTCHQQQQEFKGSSLLSRHLYSTRPSSSQPNGEALHSLPLVRGHFGTNPSLWKPIAYAFDSARDNDAVSIQRILEESPTDPTYVLRSRTTAETPLHVCIHSYLFLICVIAEPIFASSLPIMVVQIAFERSLPSSSFITWYTILMWSQKRVCMSLISIVGEQDVNEESFESRWTPLVRTLFAVLF